MFFNKIRLSGLKDVDLHIHTATPQDRFLLKGADGLDPPPINVNLSDIAFEGSIFQNRRATNREIVIRVGLNPVLAANERHSDLRDELYGLLSTSDPSEKIYVKLMNGAEVVAQTEGWVKLIEAVMFTQDPEAQITIACPKPYFRSPAEIELVSETFLNDAYSAYHPVITNPGNASTGFYMEIVWDAAATGFNFTNDPTFAKSLMTVGPVIPGLFEVDDVLIFDTRIGQRKIDRVRDGVTESLLRYFYPTSIWAQLQPGVNNFYTYPFFAFHFQSFRFYAQYWGV